METTADRQLNLTRAFILCALAYMIAACAAITSGILLTGLHSILIAFIADIIATLIIYIFSRVFENASFYDPYWSIAPPLIALFWLSPVFPGNIMRQLIVLILVFAWALRLTSNWARQWQGLRHEDWRYIKLRNQSGKWFWLVDLFGIEIMPTVMVFIGCLSLYPALTVPNNPFGFLDILAMIVTLGAIVIETAADEQLKIFVKNNDNKEAVMSHGLWAFSRHPNYFGEILFWWGLYIFALAADINYWWTIVGPIVITILFLAISIPMMEKRNLERRNTAYQVYRNKVSMLIPLPNKK
jgi:steroid 5-alpha reductase family enzyme